MKKYKCGRCNAVFVSNKEDEDCIICGCMYVYKVPMSFGDESPEWDADESSW